MNKYEIWGFEWITTFLGNPIPSRLIISAKNKETNELDSYTYEKSEVELFLLSLDTKIFIDDLNKELVSELLDYYNL